MFGADELQRYARHLVVKEIGGAGQQRLKAARVAVIGAGGLGNPAIAYLAAAGVGTIGVIDDDHVSLDNLQRQILFRAADIGAGKAAAAARFVGARNPHCELVVHAVRLVVDNAQTLLAPYDLVLDGCDNFATRRAAAAAAAGLARPLVSGAVTGWDGQVTIFAPRGRGFADLYAHAPSPGEAQNCETLGVVGPATGVIGALMAMEAIKLITGAGTPLTDRVLLYDGRAARFTELVY